MALTAPTVADVCLAARRAAPALAVLDGATKNAGLLAIADALLEREEEIVEANARDLEDGVQDGLSSALLDRLRLDPVRVAAMAAGVRSIAALPDPVGEVIDGFRLASGIDVRRVRVPIGVIAVVYEARPNVTIDAAALALKAGNAIVLRGSSSAQGSNAVLSGIARDALLRAGFPGGSLGLVAGGGREELTALATQSGVIDLIIPRGGEGLKQALEAVARVPVMYAAAGNCHVYVDADADLDAAERIIINAKVQRPGVCNAAETLLVHADAAATFLPRALAALAAHGVELRVDERARALSTGVEGELRPVEDEDWDREYLAPTLAVGVVDSAEEAIAHINAHGSGHSEAIVTRDTRSAHAFQLGVDAACVFVNASTRFTDGAEFGMGAEIGSSTQRLHARGPIGLRELCTYKYLLEGTGQVRA